MKLFKKLAIMAMAAFAFTACEDVPAPYNLPGEGSGNGTEGGGTTTEGVYIDETFATGFGIFSAVETQGEYPWIIDYKTAKATSYDNGTNNPAESWLISLPIDLSDETEAYIAFEYIIRYAESGKVAKNHQLLISSDYTDDPATATWTSLDYGAVEGTDWVTFYKANVAIPADFLGKNNITVALKYTATTKAGTWEVKNFKMAHGTPTTEEEPEATEMTVAEAMAAFIDGQQIPAIVTGYIVGSIDDKSITDDANFSASAVLKTNLLIADNADETDISKCMPVQLPSGNVRDALNLVDNAGNYKKQVKLTGSIEKYFGVAGLKNVSEYTIDGVPTDTPDNPTGTYISETFATTFGSFTTQQTVGNYPWIIDYSTAKATSYDNGTNNPAESWLISPAVDFSNETEACVKFEYIIRYAESGKAANNHQLLISSDYTDDPATATWTSLDYGAVEGTDWVTFYKANVAVPSEFIGKNNVTFALKYTATTKAGTWEVKNFTVAHGTPTTEEKPEATEMTVAEAMTAFIDGQQIPAIVTGYIVGSIDGMSITNDTNFSASAVQKTNLLIADNADETDISKCMPVQLPSGNVRDALNLVDNAGNYKKQVKLTGNIEKYFGVAGLKGVSAFEFTGGNNDNTTPGEGENDDNEEDSDAAAAEFNFADPTSLDPSVTPAAPGNGVEFEDITFTNGDVNIRIQQNTATTKVKIYTKNGGSTELRSYKNSIITVTGEGISKIKFDGQKLNYMSPDNGSFSNGVWTGNSDRVIINVTGGVSITKITVE